MIKAKVNITNIFKTIFLMVSSDSSRMSDNVVHINSTIPSSTHNDEIINGLFQFFVYVNGRKTAHILSIDMFIMIPKYEIISV